MRLAVLFKRAYMGKDLVLDRYGRLFHLPYCLSQLDDNEVHLVALDYRQADCPGALAAERLTMEPVYFPLHNPVGAMRTIRRIYRDMKAVGPDVLISGSDMVNITIGAWIASRLNIPHVVDLYDNFESFGLSRFPGLKRLYRNALGNAALITCVSNRLARYIVSRYRPACPVLTIESTVDTDRFVEMDKRDCRKKLGLPEKAMLVGTAGSLSESHDVGVLYEAYRHLWEANPGIRLVLAGRVSKNLSLPEFGHVDYLGELDNRDVALLFNTLDVAVICLKDSDFGRYAFPQKAYEIIATRTPVVATGVGAMSELFASYPGCLSRPGDHRDMADKIQAQLEHPCIADIPVPSWRDQAIKVNDRLRGIVSSV